MRKAVMMLGLLTGLAAGAPVPAEQASPSPDAVPCRLPLGWDQVAAKRARFVVFGEVHGTRESPAFVGNIACALAAKGERVLVAVEHFSTANDDFQKAWALPDSAFVPALTKSGWAGRDDGVASEAMLAMLVRLHRLAQAGRKIDIVAFSGVKDEAQARRFADLAGQGSHDAAQAENIRQAAALRHYDHILVLAGNTHARKHPVTYTSSAFEPMAMRLGRSVPVVTLNMKVAGGTVWTCEPKANGSSTQDESECAPHPAWTDSKLKREPFVALGNLPGLKPDSDYDGVYWLGPVSASPPAVPDQSPNRNP